jgi:adenosylcobyric acid synthase
MFIARAAEAPVLLAGDIDRGGVFAAFVGTLSLLEPEDRARIRGFLVNKFRGDVSLLEPGLDWLREHTGVPVLGVLPHLGALRIAEEDSLNVDARRGRPHGATDGQIQIAVLRLPRISNHDEFQPFEHEPDVALTFTDDPGVALAADLLIVPGTKSTVSDLAWLRAEGLDHVLRLRAQRGAAVLGICGGCQMLGGAIADPEGVESCTPNAEGLGLLALRTRFVPHKNTRRVHARHCGESWLFAGLSRELEVPGYFIHAGPIEAAGPAAFEARAEDGVWRGTGASNAEGNVVGTMVHGLFEHDDLRHALLAALRERRGLGPAGTRARWNRQAEYDRLAQMIAAHCDTNALEALALGG